MASVLLSGCPTRDISKLDQTPTSEYRQNVNVSQNRNIDILFVIDNSDSMEQEQESLARNFPLFIDVLNSIEGGLPNVHIGVVSSDLGLGDPSFPSVEQCSGNGDNGILQVTPREQGCIPPNGFYIEDTAVSGGRQRNYDETQGLAGTFSCIAHLGVTGCGAEMHLASMDRALYGSYDGSIPENQGFLRDDAYLAVVIIGDEDDCSANDPAFLNPVNDPEIVSRYGPFGSFRCTEFGVMCDGMTLPRAAGTYNMCVPRPESDGYLHHPQYFVDRLRALKANPNLLIVSVIAGNPTPFQVALTDKGAPKLQPSCESEGNGTADPAVRLKYFADQFGENGDFETICQNDLSDSIQKIAELLKKIIGTPCLEANIDTTDIDPTQPGLQLQCNVADTRFLGQEGSTEKTIARCKMLDASTPDTTGVSGTQPCWWAIEDAAKCSAENEPTHIALHIERGGDDAPIGTTVVARCAVKE